MKWIVFLRLNYNFYTINTNTNLRNVKHVIKYGFRHNKNIFICANIINYEYLHKIIYIYYFNLKINYNIKKNGELYIFRNNWKRFIWESV